MPAASNDQYAPWRTSIDAMRLSCQHFLWREQLHYNLHPSIKLQKDASLEIADVATGHCLWALQVAETLGPNIKIEASDITLELCPQPYLLSAGMKLRKWDVFDPVPEDWLARFDLVHVRLIVAAFGRGKDPQPILEKFVSMLKPGGYLQWDEYEYSPTHACVSHNAPPGISDPTTTHRFAEDFYSNLLAGFGWPAAYFDHLDDHFSALGLVDIVSEKKEEKRASVAMAFHEFFVSMCVQMVGIFQKIDPPRAGELEELLGKYIKGAKEDGVLCSPIPKVVVGRKP